MFVIVANKGIDRLRVELAVLAVNGSTSASTAETRPVSLKRASAFLELLANWRSLGE